MELDLTVLLLGLPVAFVLGWLAARFDLRQWRDESRRAPKAYFKGLNYLLNEQQDQAIDAFIEAVQSDPDTTELHFALGNLFRRRGEYHRAVRVHEHLLSRADLSRADRERAQHALALDFLKAGLLDRAEDALRRLEGSAFEAQARLALLAIYERSRDWQQAGAIAARMQADDQGDYSVRQAHYLCEQAQTLLDQANPSAAQALLEQAIATAPNAARARLELARLHQRNQQPQAVLDTLAPLPEAHPAALPLAAPLLVDASLALAPQHPSTLQQVRALVHQHYQRQPTLDLLEALVTLERASAHSTTSPTPAPDPRRWYLQHLAHEPSLVAAAQWLAGQTLAPPEHQHLVQQALEQASKPLTRYRCAACGFEARQHFWHCPGCQSWDSYPARRVEEL